MPTFPLLISRGSGGEEQLLRSWVVERQPEWAGIFDFIHCKLFLVSFQSLEGAVISRLTIYWSLGWGSSSIAPGCGEPEIYIY